MLCSVVFLVCMNVLTKGLGLWVFWKGLGLWVFWKGLGFRVTGIFGNMKEPTIFMKERRKEPAVM